MLRHTLIAATLLGTLAFNINPVFACGSSSAELVQSGTRPAPARCGAAYNRAMQLAYEKNWMDAIAAVKAQIADEHGPVDADLLELLAYLLGKAGDDPGAVENYQKAIALEPMRFSAHKLLAQLYADGGQAARAESELAVLEAQCANRCGEMPELRAAIVTAGRTR